MLPPAPRTLSMTSGWPHMSPSFGACRRDRKSGAPPRGAGTKTPLRLRPHLVGEALGDRAAADRRQPGARVAPRAIDEQARGVDLHRHLGEAQLHRLEINDRLAELLALLHVRESIVERGLRDG